MNWKINLLAAIGLAAFAAFADDITAAKYPDADSVTVDEIERVKYNPDGTYVTEDECWTKILTEKGRREESTLSLHYSKRYGAAAIEYVGAIGADGVERVIDVTATTKESTDNSSMSANIYDPLDRRIVCTVPGLKIGETLHVKTRRSTFKARCQNEWADLSVMEWSHPILKSTFEVTAPKELPIKKSAVRHPLGNVTAAKRTLADGSTVHTFVCTNSPQCFPEPDMPQLYTQVQHVRVSTAEDWPEISRWYWNICAPHLAKTNAAMIAKIEELKARVKGEEELMKAIFKFVSQEIRYMGLTMEDTSPGYAPHDVDITFDNRYGVCRDKAGLLAAMLRLAGFNAFPVLIHVGAKLDQEIPQPFFNHAIVAVEKASISTVQPPTSDLQPYLLMDPTNENTKDLFPAYLCDKSYLVARPEGETLRTSPTPSAAHNALAVTTKGTLAKDGSMFVESTLRFSGINDTAYRGAFARWKGEDRVKFFDRLMKAVSPGAEIVRVEIEPQDMRDTSKPIVITVAANLPEMLLKGKTRSELNLPTLSKALGVVNFLLRGNTSLEKRKYPLVLDTTAQTDELLEIDLGGHVGAALELPSIAAVQPSTSDLQLPYEYCRDFKIEDGKLKMHRRLTIGAVEFSSAEYAALREEIKRTEAAERKRPVFAVNRLADADVHILLDRSETDVVSEREWTNETTVVKAVLTYEGKKKSAELKFGYNPSVKYLELVEASVSNRNGKVYRVTEKEQNVMDAGWTAKAPRYAASKQLIVNLPSVEIGSVIRYTLRSVTTNAPAAYYGTFAFDAYEPVERRIARVNDFRREESALKRLANEPNQPATHLWRDTVTISSNRFTTLDLQIPEDLEFPNVQQADDNKIKTVRDWMAKYVRVAGPSLYELPVAQQLTAPTTVLKERYATRLDYVRTLCALLRGEGYDARVVFAADNAEDDEAERRRDMYERPNVRVFAHPLCVVTEREGGFLGFGGTVKTYYLGTENEHTPIETTAYENCDYYDPESGEFGRITLDDRDFAARAHERSVYSVRENGAVDLAVENLLYGAGVGAFRKRYAEMLPEDRSRHYQALLGAVAQAATATRELETDVEAYPAVKRFECFVPDYATVTDGAITLQVPPLVSNLATFTGKERETPFAIGGSGDESEEVTIRFPEGYVNIECLPEDFAFTNPLDPDEVWLENRVTSEVKENVLTVVLRRTAYRRRYSWYRPELIESVKDQYRRANSRASRTISVRR